MVKIETIRRECRSWNLLLSSKDIASQSLPYPGTLFPTSKNYKEKGSDKDADGDRPTGKYLAAAAFEMFSRTFFSF